MKWITIILPSVLIICLFYIFKPNNTEINKTLKNLQAENKMLKIINDSILFNIGSMEKIKQESDKKIAKLIMDEQLHNVKISLVNTKLTNLKIKYEKATSYSNNFSTTDVQLYFADSIR